MNQTESNVKAYANLIAQGMRFPEIENVVATHPLISFMVRIAPGEMAWRPGGDRHYTGPASITYSRMDPRVPGRHDGWDSCD